MEDDNNFFLMSVYCLMPRVTSHALGQKCTQHQACHRYRSVDHLSSVKTWILTPLRISQWFQYRTFLLGKNPYVNMETGSVQNVLNTRMSYIVPVLCNTVADTFSPTVRVKRTSCTWSSVLLLLYVRTGTLYIVQSWAHATNCCDNLVFRTTA